MEEGNKFREKNNYRFKWIEKGKGEIKNRMKINNFRDQINSSSNWENSHPSRKKGVI